MSSFLLTTVAELIYLEERFSAFWLRSRVVSVLISLIYLEENQVFRVVDFFFFSLKLYLFHNSFPALC